MNWYKKAQQQDFAFVQKISPKTPPPIEESEEYQKLIQRTPDLMESLIEKCNDIKQAENVLKLYKFKTKILKDVVVIYVGNETFILDKSLTIKNPYDWIWSIYDLDLDNYVPEINFNKKFWQYPQILYHTTSKNNVPFILEKGLVVKNETRGIDNRNTGAAVFTSENPDELEPYGDTLIEINTPLMKKDGYMPNVNREDPIIEAEKRESLARMIGLENFEVEIEQGISPSTVVVYDNIPPKYLKINP